MDKIKSRLINMMPEGIKDRIKRQTYKIKTNFPQIVKFFNGSFTTKDLLIEIDSQIPENTEVLMFHTSFNNLKPMYTGNVGEFIDDLLEYAIAKKITLVFPGFVLGKRNKGTKRYFLDKKKFDLKKTATTVGLINEYFRRKEGVVRSAHPSHSLLAFGPKANEIVSSHHLCDTTFGRNTPFHKLESYNTSIIGLGTYYYRNLTHVHVVEDLLGDNFVFPSQPSHEQIPVQLILPNSKYEYKLRVFKKEVSNRRDLTILAKYVDKSTVNQYTYKGAPMFVVDPKKLTERLISLAEEGVTIYK